MASLHEDTVADKVVRFVIGAILGFVLAGFLALQWDVEAARAFGRIGVVAAVATGVGAVVFGNAFIEGALRQRWWH
jgi:uncharacterized ion transporter superfamily protein YfcC